MGCKSGPRTLGTSRACQRRGPWATLPRGTRHLGAGPWSRFNKPPGDPGLRQFEGHFHETVFLSLPKPLPLTAIVQNNYMSLTVCLLRFLPSNLGIRDLRSASAGADIPGPQGALWVLPTSSTGPGMFAGGTHRP